MRDIYVVMHDGVPVIAHTTWQGAAAELAGLAERFGVVENINLIDDDEE